MPFSRFLEKPNLELLGRPDPTRPLRPQMRVQLHGVCRVTVNVRSAYLCRERIASDNTLGPAASSRISFKTPKVMWRRQTKH